MQIKYEKLKKENEILKERLKARKYQDKELIRLFKDMQQCYLSNRKLCEWQEEHINKLATALEKIEKLLSGHKIADETRIKTVLDIINRISRND